MCMFLCYNYISTVVLCAKAFPMATWGLAPCQLRIGQVRAGRASSRASYPAVLTTLGVAASEGQSATAL